jgi:SOS-response transcriptional repressor LexA
VNEASKAPSVRQGELLDFIRAHRTEHGYSPTLREMCVALRVASHTAVNEHLAGLERKGLIRRSPNVSRSVVPVESAPDEACSHPRYACAVCGFVVPASETISGKLDAELDALVAETVSCGSPSLRLVQGGKP